eukprot:9171959-Pyramimonas_sp.AAC.1
MHLHTHTHTTSLTPARAVLPSSLDIARRLSFLAVLVEFRGVVLPAEIRPAMGEPLPATPTPSV